MLAAIPFAQREDEAGVATKPTPLVVRLLEARAPEVVPTPAAEPVVPAARSRPQPRPVQRPEPIARAEPIPEPVIPPVETARRAPAPQFDMLAMINARRQKREAAFEEAMRQSEAARSPRSEAPGDTALAAINRNLQALGSGGDTTGGVFTILSKGTRTGEFAFNGWRPDTQRRWREVIEVDAGQGGDIERAMVRRMIQLIREHYTGDFIWRSPRLGKSLVLSARLEDSEDLENFLLREFFGTPTLAKGVK